MNTSTDTSAQNDQSTAVSDDSNIDQNVETDKDLDLIKNLENAALCVDVNRSQETSTNVAAQTDTFVQFTKVLQFSEDFQFGILIIIVLYIAVTEVIPPAVRVQTILDPNAGDPLQRETLINEISTKLKVAGSPG